MILKTKNILKIFGALSLFILLISIHELSHILSAILLKQEITKIGIGFANDSLLSLVFYVRVSFSNNFSKAIIAISGSLGAITFSFLISFVSIKLKNSLLFFISLSYIVSEFLYWSISPIIRIGDAHIFIKSFNISLTFYFIFTFIISILISLTFFHIYKKTFSWRAKIRKIEERKELEKQRERQFQLIRAKERFNLI